MTEEDLLIVVICVGAAYLILVGFSTAAHPLSRLTSQLGTILVRPFTLNATRADVNGRRHHLEEEVARELGQLDQTGRQARADVIQAALQTQRIRIMDQKFRSAIRSCVRTHWSVAEGLGATEMSEAARHPMCHQLRERVVDLSELLSETIETYPLLVESPELIRLHVGLHRIAPTCLAACPYWTTSFANAPRLCPPARAIGCDATAVPRDGVILDAQVIDGD